MPSLLRTCQHLSISYTCCHVSCLFHFCLTIIRHSHVVSCMSARTMLSTFSVLGDAIKKAVLQILSVLRFTSYPRRYTCENVQNVLDLKVYK